MKNSLKEIGLYMVREWGIFLILFGVIATLFQDPKILGWAMIGRLLGMIFHDKELK